MAENNELFNLEDQARINLTLTTRENIIKDMTRDGRIPIDKDDRAFLLSALDGLDRNVLTRARLKNDKNANQSQQAVANTIANLLKSVNANPQKQIDEEKTRSVHLGDAEVIREFADGEMDVGSQTLNLETFMKENPNEI